MYCMYIAKLMSGREDFSLYSRDSQRDTKKATFLVNGAILILNAL